MQTEQTSHESHYVVFVQNAFVLCFTTDEASAQARAGMLRESGQATRVEHLDGPLPVESSFEQERFGAMLALRDAQSLTDRVAKRRRSQFRVFRGEAD